MQKITLFLLLTKVALKYENLIRNVGHFGLKESTYVSYTYLIRTNNIGITSGITYRWQ